MLTQADFVEAIRQTDLAAASHHEGRRDILRLSRCFIGEVGGRQEARTPDLRVANAALSQLS